MLIYCSFYGLNRWWYRLAVDILNRTHYEIWLTLFKKNLNGNDYRYEMTTATPIIASKDLLNFPLTTFSPQMWMRHSCPCAMLLVRPPPYPGGYDSAKEAAEVSTTLIPRSGLEIEANTFLGFLRPGKLVLTSPILESIIWGIDVIDRMVNRPQMVHSKHVGGFTKLYFRGLERFRCMMCVVSC